MIGHSDREAELTSRSTDSRDKYRMSTSPAERSWFTLSPVELRVLGVLVEGQKTGKEYPMTPHAILKGANQKWDRKPIADYDLGEVEEALKSLWRKGAVEWFQGSGMR